MDTEIIATEEIQAGLIRPLSVEDSATVAQLIHESRLVSPNYPVGGVWTQDQISAACTIGGWAYISSPCDQILAFVLAHRSAAVLDISYLATAPAARGRGVMFQLLLHLIRTRETDQQIWLEVHESNLPARRLYEKAGFACVGKRCHYYTDRGHALLYNYG